jgi:hypothetical protein
MAPQELGIPGFREDGYLPEGLYLVSESEVTFRFGTSNRTRRRLTIRVRRWIELARLTNSPRLMIDGSYITSKLEPNDVDAVVLLPSDFDVQIANNITPAIELEHMLLTRWPEEIFAAEEESDWNDWIEFFARTREADGRLKGLIEIEL